MPKRACLGHRCAWLGRLESQEQLHALALHHLRLQGRGRQGAAAALGGISPARHLGLKSGQQIRPLSGGIVC